MSLRIDKKTKTKSVTTFEISDARTRPGRLPSRRRPPRSRSWPQGRHSEKPKLTAAAHAPRSLPPSERVAGAMDGRRFWLLGTGDNKKVPAFFLKNTGDAVQALKRAGGWTARLYEPRIRSTSKGEGGGEGCEGRKFVSRTRNRSAS